jgi:predicted phosphodiesterase
MKKISIFLILSVLLTIIGCSRVVNSKTDDNQFKFLVLSDIHVSDNESHGIRLNEFVEKFNTDITINDDVDFVATTGDNVSYIYSNRYLNRDSIDNNKLRSYIKTMSNLKVPFHITMGNHEYKVDKNRDSDGFFPESEILEMEEIWINETGFKPYYSIKKGDFNLIFLNSMRGRYQNKFFGNVQLNWFKKQIAESKKAILFFHHPMRTDKIDHWYKKRKGTMTNETEPEFYEILINNQDKIKSVFVGHGHKWMHDKLFNKIKVYETTSFGDHEEFMFYTVEVTADDIKVTKSEDAKYYTGFIEFKNKKDGK